LVSGAVGSASLLRISSRYDLAAILSAQLLGRRKGSLDEISIKDRGFVVEGYQLHRNDGYFGMPIAATGTEHLRGCYLDDISKSLTNDVDNGVVTE
jgi:hypothetical protein